jgi:hypothetical protein
LTRDRSAELAALPIWGIVGERLELHAPNAALLARRERRVMP